MKRLLLAFLSRLLTLDFRLYQSVNDLRLGEFIRSTLGLFVQPRQRTGVNGGVAQRKTLGDIHRFGFFLTRQRDCRQGVDNRL